MLKPIGDRIVIFDIINARGVDGATIGEIHADYKKEMGRDSSFFHQSIDDIVYFINSLPGLEMDTLNGGAYVWYVRDDFQNENENLTSNTLVDIDTSFTFSDESDTLTNDQSWQAMSLSSDEHVRSAADTDSESAM